MVWVTGSHTFHLTLTVATSALSIAKTVKGSATSPFKASLCVIAGSRCKVTEPRIHGSMFEQSKCYDREPALEGIVKIYQSVFQMELTYPGLADLLLWQRAAKR